MQENVKFYIADDEEKVVEAIARLVSKAFPSSKVKLFDDGVALWETIAKETGSVIIICGYDVLGINGLQVLKKLRNESNVKDSYFITISTVNNKDLPLKAMQTGTDEFLTKPFTVDQLLGKLKNASKFTNQKIKENELLAQLAELNKAIEMQSEIFESAFYKLQLSRLDNKELEIKRIISASNFIAKHLTNDEDEINNITRAAKLCYLNKIHLPDNLINNSIYSEGIIKNPTYEKIPQAITRIFDDLHGFEHVEKILYHMYENYDGSGIPSKLIGPEIPLGSRILRVAIDYEYQMTKNMNKSARVLEILWGFNNKLYDFKIVAYYDQYLGTLNSKAIHPKKPMEMKMAPKELKSSMILSRDINSITGHKLVTANTKLEIELIEKIVQSSEAGAIIGNIFVRYFD